MSTLRSSRSRTVDDYSDEEQVSITPHDYIKALIDNNPHVRFLTVSPSHPISPDEPTLNRPIFDFAQSIEHNGAQNTVVCHIIQTFLNNSTDLMACLELLFSQYCHSPSLYDHNRNIYAQEHMIQHLSHNTFNNNNKQHYLELITFMVDIYHEYYHYNNNSRKKTSLSHYINSLKDNNIPLLHIHMSNCDYIAIEGFFLLGADPNLTDSKMNQNSLIYALQTITNVDDAYTILCLSISFNMDILKMVNKSRENLFHIACNIYNTHAVQYAALIKATENINIPLSSVVVATPGSPYTSTATRSIQTTTSHTSTSTTGTGINTPASYSTIHDEHIISAAATPTPYTSNTPYASISQQQQQYQSHSPHLYSSSLQQQQQQQQQQGGPYILPPLLEPVSISLQSNDVVFGHLIDRENNSISTKTNLTNSTSANINNISSLSSNIHSNNNNNNRPITQDEELDHLYRSTIQQNADYTKNPNILLSNKKIIIKDINTSNTYNYDTQSQQSVLLAVTSAGSGQSTTQSLSSINTTTTPLTQNSISTAYSGGSTGSYTSTMTTNTPSTAKGTSPPQQNKKLENSSSSTSSISSFITNLFPKRRDKSRPHIIDENQKSQTPSTTYQTSSLGGSGNSTPHSTNSKSNISSSHGSHSESKTSGYYISIPGSYDPKQLPRSSEHTIHTGLRSDSPSSRTQHIMNTSGMLSSSSSSAGTPAATTPGSLSAHRGGRGAGGPGLDLPPRGTPGGSGGPGTNTYTGTSLHGNNNNNNNTQHGGYRRSSISQAYSSYAPCSRHSTPNTECIHCHHAAGLSLHTPSGLTTTAATTGSSGGTTPGTPSGLPGSHSYAITGDAHDIALNKHHHQQQQQHHLSNYNNHGKKKTRHHPHPSHHSNDNIYGEIHQSLTNSIVSDAMNGTPHSAITPYDGSNNNNKDNNNNNNNNSMSTTATNNNIYLRNNNSTITSNDDDDDNLDMDWKLPLAHPSMSTTAPSSSSPQAVYRNIHTANSTTVSVSSSISPPQQRHTMAGSKVSPVPQQSSLSNHYQTTPMPVPTPVPGTKTPISPPKHSKDTTNILQHTNHSFLFEHKIKDTNTTSNDDNNNNNNNNDTSNTGSPYRTHSIPRRPAHDAPLEIVPDEELVTSLGQRPPATSPRSPNRALSVRHLRPDHSNESSDIGSHSGETSRNPTPSSPMNRPGFIGLTSDNDSSSSPLVLSTSLASLSLDVPFQNLNSLQQKQKHQQKQDVSTSTTTTKSTSDTKQSSSSTPTTDTKNIDPSLAMTTSTIKEAPPSSSSSSDKTKKTSKSKQDGKTEAKHVVLPSFPTSSIPEYQPTIFPDFSQYLNETDDDDNDDINSTLYSNTNTYSNNHSYEYTNTLIDDYINILPSDGSSSAMATHQQTGSMSFFLPQSPSTTSNTNANTSHDTSSSSYQRPMVLQQQDLSSSHEHGSSSSPISPISPSSLQLPSLNLIELICKLIPKQINALSRYGKTPLHQLLWNSLDNTPYTQHIFIYLIQHNADINTINTCDGDSILHYIVQSSNTPIDFLQLVLSLPQTNIVLHNDDGKTPLDVSIQQYNTTISDAISVRSSAANTPISPIQ